MGLDEHLATKQDIKWSQTEPRIRSGIWLPAIAQSIVAVLKLLGLD